MAVNITINVTDEQSPPPDKTENRQQVEALEEHKRIFSDFAERMGSDAKPFPSAKLGGYMSHFRIVLELEIEGRKQLLSIVSPMAAQTVSWSDPFVYEGPNKNHQVNVRIPAGSALPGTISEGDFLERPAEFFQEGKETIWLQILNLDASMETDLGHVRIILGETLKKKHPDIFRPSLGVAQSIGKEGFPARLFFNPYAIIETPIGDFRAIHGTLSYGRVTNFPPIGTPVSIADCVPMEPLDEVRAVMQKRNLKVHQVNPADVAPIGQIVALTHPIDMEIQLKDEAIYDFVERSIARAESEGPEDQKQ
ncbi:hypothetical protein ACU8OT_29340 (plasmid) [Rhizobium leguminosarum]